MARWSDRYSRYDETRGGGAYPPQRERYQDYQQVDPYYDQDVVPRQNLYGSQDRPITNEGDKLFVKREIRKLKLRTFIGLGTFSIILLAAAILMAIYLTGTLYTFESVEKWIDATTIIKGEGHLAWMAAGGLIGLIGTLFFLSKWYLLSKDSDRVRTVGQNDYFVPLSLKKYYRALKANNTFIHYFATLGYIGMGLSIGICYLISYENTFVNDTFIVFKSSAELYPWVITFGSVVGAIFALHLVWIILRKRKVTQYDARFGIEIVPTEQIIALRKRNRRICIFITLALIIVGVMVYFIIKKFKPSVPSLLKLK